ncbi:hypothetical protein K502DRAFT_353270 [Neoconidiobolus thromboides FSU 785]|nr:hypothetical protein K502DRAFT_353270 [Neoconidiobolus thromboides FSU 785]
MLNEIKTSYQIIIEENRSFWGLGDPKYINSRKENIITAKEAIDFIINKYKLDVLLAPSDIKLDIFSLPVISRYTTITILMDIDQNEILSGMFLYYRENSDVGLLDATKVCTLMADSSRATPRSIN